MKRSGKFLVSLLVILLGAGGAYLYYTREYLPAQAAPVAVVQTARARTGDIKIVASGAGNLVSATEVNLSFRSPGLLTALEVSPGEVVEAGQVLARQDDTTARFQLEQAQLTLDALTSPLAVAEAERDLADALTDLEEAEYARLSQQEGYRASDNTLATVKAELLLAEQKVQKAWEKYAPLSGKREDNLERAAALAAYTAAVEARDVVARELNWYLGSPNELDQAKLDADVAIAETRVAAAEAMLAELKGEPLPPDPSLAVSSELNQLRQARLTLENAQFTLENTVLTAPISGTVIGVNASVGESVSSNPILTIATLDQPLIRFNLEEADLNRVAVGNPAEFIFDAYPDQVIEGTVLRLEPTLDVIDGTPVITAWASVVGESAPLLLSGMATDVEVVAGESNNTLLVPVQALRELSPGAYAVFLVQPEGELKLTPVTVGLKDFANAEILSGLKAGDVVSTGTVETK